MVIFRATMLEQCCDSSKQCWNNVAMLCCAENRRCESSRVIRQYLKSSTVYASAFLVHNTNETLVLLLEILSSQLEHRNFWFHLVTKRKFKNTFSHNIQKIIKIKKQEIAGNFVKTLTPNFSFSMSCHILKLQPRTGTKGTPTRPLPASLR